jgi:D-glycero-D-manno-heptose 1,7-bisphosphate phosphatase
VLRFAVFLDRDGTICKEVGYLNHARRLVIFPFAANAIRRMKQAGMAVIVATNQSGVARKYFPDSLVREVNERLRNQLAEEGALAWHSVAWPVQPNSVTATLTEATDWTPELSR